MLLSAVLPAAGIANSSATHAPYDSSLTYTVTVPVGSHGCFIAGEMNGWTPHEMNRVTSTTYSVTIAGATASMKYKYLSGPAWAYVEKGAPGGGAPNRTYHPEDTVARWASVWNPAENTAPHVSAGTLKRFFFHSRFVDARNIDVWLPAGYDSTKKYAVLYMQDGQMLFDSALTWNHQDWQVAETMSRLLSEDRIRPTIVVGIWNNGNKRAAEYFPEKAFAGIAEPYRDSLSAFMPGGPAGDDYLKFMVTELKPFIDSAFSVYRDRDNTFVMGSSYGGLIALYALSEYPQVFGGAACMSTHWIGLFWPNKAIPAAITHYLEKNLPAPAGHKLYFDYGSKTLDRFYGPYQRQVDSIVRSRGYGAADWMTRHFPGMDHSERSWAKRLHIPLVFLLAPKTKS
jgi:enterochelin esterase-like enzyme